MNTENIIIVVFFSFKFFDLYIWTTSTVITYYINRALDHCKFGS